MKILLNRAYGGFHLPKMVYESLLHEYKWDLVTDYDYKQREPREELYKDKYTKGYCFTCYKSNIFFRSHIDIIQLIERFQKQYRELYDEKLTYNYKYDQFTEEEKKLSNELKHLFAIKVFNLDTIIEIEDYNDGFERVSFTGHANEVDDD